MPKAFDNLAKIMKKNNTKATTKKKGLSNLLNEDKKIPRLLAINLA